MVMPRLSWSLFAAVGFTLLPSGTPMEVMSLQRTTLIRDTAFRLPDSVRAVLNAITRVVVAPDNSLYISDYQFPAILHLESSGEYREALGRAGAGPGEFYQVFSIGLYRDSIWAMDPGQVRVTLFPLSGKGNKTLPYGPYAPRGETPGAYSRRGAPVSVLPDGSLLLEENTVDPFRPKTGWLLQVDRSMRVIDTVSPLPAEHTQLAFEFRDGQIHWIQPFADDRIYALSMDGSTLVLVDRPIATGEEEGQFTITALANGNREVFRRVVRYQPRRLNQRTVDEAVDSLGRFKPQGMKRSPLSADSIRNRMYRPAFYPPVKTARVGRDGTIWLKVVFGDSPTGSDEWMQLSPRGLPLRRVSTPAGFRLLESDGRMVWGTFADSLDVPQLERYEIDRNTLN